MDWKEWLDKHNFQEALRVAVDNLKQTGNYEPFADLATENEAVVLVTIDKWDNIHFRAIHPVITRIQSEVKEEPAQTTELAPTIIEKTEEPPLPIPKRRMTRRRPTV